MKLAIYRVTNVTSQIHRYNGFVVRTLTITDVDGTEVKLDLFSDGDESPSIETLSDISDAKE